MIYEYRAYYVMPGRMPDIQRRFADVTMKLFAKHGIRVVGFWDTVIGESDELVYICAFDDLAHRQRAWSAFLSDPEWQAAKKSTEANGPLVERDEVGHSEMGHRFLAEIVGDARGRALVQRLLAKWYPAALDMFGRSDSQNAPKFIRWGLKSVGNAEIRAAYKSYVDAKLVALGLEPPDERANRRFL